jgi:hypothetical protein
VQLRVTHPATADCRGGLVYARLVREDHDLDTVAELELTWASVRECPLSDLSASLNATPYPGPKN